MDATISGWKFKDDQDASLVSKYLRQPQIFINYKGGHNKFTAQKLGRHFYILKVPPPAIRQISIMTPQYDALVRARVTPVAFSPKLHNLCLVIKIHHRNPNWGAHTKLTSKPSGSMEFMEEKERLMDCHRLETEETWQGNTMWDSR